MDRKSSFRLWLAWVSANGAGEVIGLGATLAVDFLIISRVAAAQSGPALLLGIVLVTASGAIEGIVVGFLQWSVLRRRFSTVSRRSWIVATVIGAVVAWFFGSLPSTLMDVGGQAAGGGTEEPEMVTVLLLAATMGLFLGLILGYPQWRVLRRAVPEAWLWIPANSVAWTLDMPLVFAAVDLAQQTPSTRSAVAVMAGGLLLTGVIVGAVHGLALVRLARSITPEASAQVPASQIA